MREALTGGAVPLDRLDPRARLLFALAAAALMSCLRGLPAACGALALGGLLLALGWPGIRPVRRSLAAVNAFLLLLWLVLPLTMPGEPLDSGGWLHVSGAGLRLALLTTLKANAVACVFMALVAGLSAPVVGHALERLRCPRKLVFLFLFTARQAQTMAADWHTLLMAARLRGFRPGTDGRTYRTLASLLGLLLVRGYARARRMREAMLLRGFAGQFRSVAVFRAGRADAVAGLLLAGGLAALAALDLLGGTHGC